MIQGLIEILVDFGLMRSDWKHRKKIKKKEQKHGRNYPVQKYLLSPSIKFFVIVMGLALVVGLSIRWYKNAISKPKATHKEIVAIHKAAEEWKEAKGTYPSSLEQLIGKRATRKKWIKDFWGTKYSVESNLMHFSVSSAGPDKLHDSDDDIKEKLDITTGDTP